MIRITSGVKTQTCLDSYLFVSAMQRINALASLALSGEFAIFRMRTLDETVHVKRRLAYCYHSINCVKNSEFGLYHFFANVNVLNSHKSNTNGKLMTRPGLALGFTLFCHAAF